MRSMTMRAPKIIPRTIPEADSWTGVGLGGVFIIVVIFEYGLC